ncbi:tryptophan 2,3-dioxygenase [Streptomyces sp. A7024]|uniref:Tryptophan 2,3-dioxygenase n=1 Tax=Streptomyces coryli TaxID=1128680 RepID=A0A6G4TWW7_9ACTN|nr:tryptophan 2,3-dioxygenase family protein [Streptomyces coryli]NGN63537.1 tryptophan 2,3-dioxygenase [Streptomyces coryli]
MHGDRTYGDYARLPQLLAQHAPLSATHDEHLFIAAHQVHELWFRQLLTELADARDRLLAGELRTPADRLRRCTAITGALRGTLDVLDTMPPAAFAEFRGLLGESSGAQSAQFHEIEALCGRRGAGRVLGLDWPSAAERGRLERRLAEPSVWDGYLKVRELPGAGAVAEALLGFDRGWGAWRDLHVTVAGRQIGAAAGTGGTSGVAHLRARLGNRLFPELWGPEE